jgi:YVTN family beta-propeller protein
MSAVNPPQRVGIIHRSTMTVDEVDVFIPRPHAVAVDPRGGYAYVGSLAENQIATINGNTEQVTLSKIPGDSMRMIVELAVSPDGTRMVGTDQMGSAVLVFDATTPTALRQLDVIPVDPWPWHVSFTPDGKQVWLGSQRGNSVTAIDAGTWKVDAVVKGNGLAEPHGIVISPDGRTVFVSNHNQQGAYTPAHPRPKGTGTVVAIDRARHTISRVIETDGDAVGMSLTGRP